MPHQWPIPVGAMIETPSAALLIDQLLPHLDFVSIGTNDLTQYVLCAERGSASVIRVLRFASSSGSPNLRAGDPRGPETGGQSFDLRGDCL